VPAANSSKKKPDRPPRWPTMNWSSGSSNNEACHSVPRRYSVPMSLADQRSASQLQADEGFSRTKSGPECGRRVRKRRYHIPRQALGFDFFQLHRVGDVEPPSSAQSAAPLPLVEPLPLPALSPSPNQPVAPVEAVKIAEAEFQLNRERLRTLCRRAIWTCLILLSIILFRDWILLFLCEAPYAWPSINGGG
jgi:hypothetical protein